MLGRIKTSLYSRSPFLTKKMLSGKGFIFMLHRVLPNEERSKYTWNQGLAISPEGLERNIKRLQELDYDFISIDEVEERLKDNSDKKWIVFTLDDGYSDNLNFALPIFEKHNIPFTIYVSNCFPNNNAIYWWYDLEKYILNNDSVNLNPININLKVSNQSEEEKTKNYKTIRELLRKGDLNLHKSFLVNVIGESLNEYFLKHSSINLTWEELASLNKHPLVTIGAHTLNHLSLKNQNDENVKVQIIKGLEEMETKLGCEISHFAYPYGSLDDVDLRSVNVLRSKNVKSAVLNHPGGIFKEHINYPYQLPRMGLSDETSAERLDDFLSGKLHLNFNGVDKVIKL